ncbi:MAG: dihydroneopterin aldolase [Thermoleophilia bacterium]|nr:dihydroneopterin aldolase [Thermoleophilia bacterium]
MNGRNSSLRITIKGLEVFAHHGVLPEEREQGQRFLFDIGISLKRSAASESDKLEDTVDYAAVCDVAVETATGESCRLLEKLAAMVADAILESFPAIDRVKVRVAKPEPPIAHTLGEVAVMVKRTRA